MNEANIAKLADYITGFKELNNPEIFPIGAVLVKDTSDREEVLQSLKEQSLAVIEDGEVNQLLSELCGFIKDSKAVMLNLKNELDPKLLNFLLEFSAGKVQVSLVGEEQTIINPIPNGAKILLLLDTNLYDNTIGLGRVVTSACKL